MKKLFKNKALKYVLVGVLIIGITMASILIASSSCSCAGCNNEEAEEVQQAQEMNSFRTKDSVSYLESIYYGSNDYIFFVLTSQRTTEIEKATYSIDNQNEVDLRNTTKKENKENEFYFEGRPEDVIFTETLTEGTHIINFYVYTNGVKKEVVSRTFKIVGSAVASQSE